MYPGLHFIVVLTTFFSALVGLAPARAAPGDSIIIIANKSYRSGIAPVEFADRDADAMEKAAREAMGIAGAGLKRFDDMTVGEANSWFRADGTPGDELKAFVRRASADRRDATVYFYYSGHGVATRNETRQQDEMHFVLYDTRTDAVGTQGLSIETVRRALTQVQKEFLPAGRVVMMIDACFSGFGRDGKEVWKGARAGAVPARLSAPDKVVILSAAGPTEPAWSDLQRKQGAFTDAVVDGLYGGAADSAGRITAEGLLAYVERRVASRLSRQTTGARSQSPMLTGERTALVATLKAPFPERVTGTQQRFARRCAVVGATSDMSVVREFLQNECDEDCPCRASLETRLGERDKRDSLCKEERDDFAGLKARGAAAVAEMKALASVVRCEAVKVEIAAAVTALDEAQRDKARRAQEKLDREAKERADKAARAAKESADKDARRLEEAAREMAAKEAEIRAAKAAKERTEREDRARVEKEAKDRTDKEALRRAAVAKEAAAKDAEARARKEAKEPDEREPTPGSDEVARRGEMDSTDKAGDTSPDADPSRSISPGSGASFRDCDDCPEMIVIPSGSFVMGSATSEEGRDDDEGPDRRVRIDETLAIGKFEVTREQFELFIKADGHKMADSCFIFTDGAWASKTGVTWKAPAFKQSDRDPVVCVDWNDAKAYVAWLSRQTGRNYRLLTEAEWEYAARAETTSAFSTGRTITTDDANFDGNVTFGDNPKGVRRGGTVRVGSFGANDWGLSDMHGNAFEWVEDCYVKDYSDAPTDGTAVTQDDCKQRAVRGGSWVTGAAMTRSAARSHAADSVPANALGFRVARTID